MIDASINGIGRYWRLCLVLVAMLFLTGSLGLTSSAAPAPQAKQAKLPEVVSEPEIRSGELLIKLKPSARNAVAENAILGNTGVASLDVLNREVGASNFQELFNDQKTALAGTQLDGWYKVELPGSGKTLRRSKNAKEFERLEQVIRRYAASPNVEVAEPNYVAHSTLAPNDPWYSSRVFFGSYDDMWGLKKINAESAWNYTTGSSSVLVAVHDSGVDGNHPDMAANMWADGSEPLNGVDDNGNGYVDDRFGWDFVNNDRDPNDDVGHGTMVAGIIGAAGNNGDYVVGTNWQVKIMGLKVLASNGKGTEDNIVRSIRYAADRGVKVSNLSLSCLCTSAAYDDAVKYATDRGVVVVAAAGNNNQDALNESPASSDGAITVGATNVNDQLAVFRTDIPNSASNFGPRIDVVAPGHQILSIPSKNGPMCGVSDYGYVCYSSGTSFSAPFVAGVAALIKARNPGWTNREITQTLRTSSIDIGSSGKDNQFGYGRLDAARALSQVIMNQRPITPYFSNLSSRSKHVLNVGQNAIVVNGAMPGPNFSNYVVELGKGRSPSTWSRAVETNATRQLNSSGPIATIGSQFFDGSFYTIRFTAFTAGGQRFEAQVFDVQLGTASVGQPPSVSITYPALNQTVSGTITVKANITDDKGITKGELLIDGHRLLATDTTAPYEFAWNTANETNGNHTVTVKGYDTDGNVTEQTIGVVVSNSTTPVSDTTKPTVSISSPTNYSWLRGTVTIAVSASDNVGVQRVELYYGDNVLIGTDTTAPYTFSFDTRVMPNGYNAIVAVAYDAANNAGSAANIYYVYN
jgi:thermitase